ncbi:hypothetical protein RDI58_019681 [Solanum bulbocastanum]|uniref:Uncharacterized protein n=1 Tax=Solanum bulbocastanum TaxID=147425 RepID=A0AAN8Y6R6_SOLBU
MNPPWPQDQGDVRAPPMRSNTSFIEISNLENVALMILPEGEDKKYIHILSLGTGEILRRPPASNKHGSGQI